MFSRALMSWCDFRRRSSSSTSATVFRISSDRASSETARANDIAPTSALNVRIAFDLAARLSLPGSKPAIVCDSVLYERTNDAQIDGHITPVSARINGQVQQVNVIEGQLVHAAMFWLLWTEENAALR